MYSCKQCIFSRLLIHWNLYNTSPIILLTDRHSDKRGLSHNLCLGIFLYLKSLYRFWATDDWQNSTEGRGQQQHFLRELVCFRRRRRHSRGRKLLGQQKAASVCLFLWTNSCCSVDRLLLKSYFGGIYVTCLLSLKISIFITYTCSLLNLASRSACIYTRFWWTQGHCY